MLDILSLARQNLRSALADPTDHLPDSGARWGTIAAHCRNTIPGFSTIEEAVHFAQLPTGHGSFEDRLGGDAILQHVLAHEDILLRSFPEAAAHFTSFAEPEISHPESTIRRHGRMVSAPLLVHTILFFNYVTRIPAIGRICEIGGGFGAPARLAMSNSYKRARSYVIVDLPESLFFAEVYLRATFGYDQVRYVQPGETISDIADSSILLCPVTRLAALAPLHFDVVLNTLSLQEMTDAYVDFYRDWLDRSRADHFYSFNYFLQPADDRAESPNLLAPRLSASWDILWSSTGLTGTPHSLANVLAQRADPETITKRNGATIAQYYHRPLDAACLPRLLHAAQTSQDATFPYRLMTAMLSDFNGAKETLFLAHLIGRLEQHGPVLTPVELELVARTTADGSERLSKGAYPNVPGHLSAMQASLYPVAPTSA